MRWSLPLRWQCWLSPCACGGGAVSGQRGGSDPVTALVRTGRPGLLPSVTCLVGLHFLPLAWIFDLAPIRLTGSLLIVVAVAGGTGYAAGLTEPTVLSIVGFGATTILWSTDLMIAKHG